ncbi:MAG: hypothetical protein AB8B67_04340 [Rickettsiaceae bacterium]
MTKAKTASRNNPESRKRQADFLYNTKKVKPVKLVIEGLSFFSAEYDDGSGLVTDSNDQPLHWHIVRNLCTRS